jgi:hypothetical protein
VSRLGQTGFGLGSGWVRTSFGLGVLLSLILSSVLTLTHSDSREFALSANLAITPSLTLVRILARTVILTRILIVTHILPLTRIPILTLTWVQTLL